jgi:excisionase family DNA binding protein
MTAKVFYVDSAEASKYLTVEEAAERLKIKPSVLRNYLYEGKLRTYKFKTLTLLSSGDVEAYRERQRD